MNPLEKTKIEETVNPTTGTITSGGTPTVTPTQLKPEAPFVTPKETTPTSSPVAPTLTPLQAYEKDTQGKATESQTEYEKLLADVGLIKAKEGGIQEQLGATQAKEAYTNYASQLEQEKRNIELENRRIFSDARYTKEQAQSAYNALENQSLQKQADIAILGNAALGKYNFALDEAKRKVDLELKPFEDKLALKKTQYENNQDKLTALEKAKVTSMLNTEEADLAEKRKDKLAANTMYVNALQSKAPQSLISEAKAIIDRGGSSSDVARVLGNYSMSQADKLDMQLKQAQISKLYSDINAPKEETAIQYKERKDKEKTEAQKAAQIPIIKEKIDLVNKLKDHAGLNTRVGPSALGLPTRTFLGAADAFGQGQDFAASVQQLTNQDTLNQLLELKAAGGTLGAVSEKELDLLQKAASKINAWEKKKNGVGIGQWNVSEKKFKEELDTVLKSSEALYQSLGGDKVQEQNLNGYLDVVDGALNSSENVYQSSGYNL